MSVSCLPTTTVAPLQTYGLDRLAALDGAGAAGRGGLAASTADLEGSGGRKKGQGSEGEGSDAGEHVGSGEESATEMRED